MSVSARAASVASATPGRPSAERAKAATRRRLVAAGRRLFARKGLRGVTTHDIAKAAGFAPGTFYLHFADKSELFREIAHSTFEELRQRIQTASEPFPTIRAGVRARVEAIVDYAERNRNLVLILFGTDAESELVETELLDKFAALIAQGRSQRVAAGEMTDTLDPAVLAQALVGMLFRVVRWWIDDPTRVRREVLIETLTNIQLGGTHPDHSKA